MVFTNAKITVTPVTLEPDVKSVLTKVELGAVDAGVVYVTDVRAAGSKVTGVPIDSSINASTSYPIATLTKAPNPSGAQAFVDYVLSSAGQTVLTQDGFADPMTARRGRRGQRARSRSRRPRLPLRSCFCCCPWSPWWCERPWRGMPRILRDSQVVEALRLSLECATAATLLSFAFGVPLAWVLARSRLRGVSLVRALVTLPLVLPPVVGGVALLARVRAPGHRRQVPRSVVRHHPAVHDGRGDRRGDVRRDAVPDHHGRGGAAGRRPGPRGGGGDPRRRTDVDLPTGDPAAIAPSLLAGGVLCWARALGEFGATITFAGNFPGTTQTMPLAVYQALESDPEAAIALSLVLLLVSVARPPRAARSMATARDDLA